MNPAAPGVNLLQTLGRHARALLVFYRTSIQAEMEYRADFFTRVLASLLGLLTTVGSLSIAFTYTDNLKGWTFAQAMVFLSVYYLMDGLIEMLIGPNMRQVTSQVREGTLDFILIKPLNTQFFASLRSINIWRAANLLVGAGLATYSVRHLSGAVGFREAFLFGCALVAGLLIIYSFWLFLVTLTFWFVRVDNLEQIVWQAFEAGRYPVEIYPRWLRAALTYVVPVALMITVPARALTGRLDAIHVLGACAIAAVLFLASSLFWRYGLRSYTGASA